MHTTFPTILIMCNTIFHLLKFMASCTITEDKFLQKIRISSSININGGLLGFIIIPGVIFAVVLSLIRTVPRAIGITIQLLVNQNNSKQKSIQWLLEPVYPLKEAKTAFKEKIGYIEQTAYRIMGLHFLTITILNVLFLKQQRQLRCAWEV